ncbi:Nucleotide-sugar transporter [Canna indica]|uniref:Nucleotide-sugar transporter n=1 Tax=Canna indica TaxID=4628 RepID=A0AAQ3JR29_9LILI|nr:Nucleotide-sugar transporter [Canna indica]
MPLMRKIHFFLSKLLDFIQLFNCFGSLLEDRKELKKRSRMGSVANDKGRLWPPQPTKDDDDGSSCYFHMPLHYPRYTKADYDSMPEWKLDHLLRDYGIPAAGDVRDKRGFAIDAFLWPAAQY